MDKQVEHTMKLEAHSRELSILNQGHTELKRRVDASEIKQVDIENLKILHGKNALTEKRLDSSIAATRQIEKDLLEAHANLVLRVKEIESKVDSLFIGLKELNSNLNDINCLFREDKARLEKEITKNRFDLEHIIENRATLITKNLAVSPRDILTSNEEIKSKLESALVGSDNAMAKCNVQAMSLKLFEKKLENMALQLKSFELNKELER